MMDITYILLLIILTLFVYFTAKINRLTLQNSELNEKLEDKEDELNSLLQLYDENVIASKTDLKGKIIYASRGFCKTSEYSKEELLGKPHNIVKHPDASKETFKELWKDLKADRTWLGEIHNLSKNGRSYWVETMITPEYDKNGTKIGYSSIRHDISAKKELEQMTLTLEKKVQERTQELEALAITDSLTGLYNRRYFEKIKQQEFKRAQRDKKSFIFSIFDVDMFKQYNDNYGHIKGDEVLIKLSEILLSLTKRAHDFVFRIGGEEFCVITSSMNETDALEFFTKLKRSIEEAKIEHNKSEVSDYVTASFGLVIVNFDQMFQSSLDERYDIQNIHKQADKLLYKAKDNGRNCIVHEVL